MTAYALILRRYIALVCLTGLICFGQKADPRRSRTLYESGLRYEAAGQQEKALQVYASALELDDNNAPARRQRGKLLLALKRCKDAMADIDASIRVDSTDAESY